MHQDSTMSADADADADTDAIREGLPPLAAAPDVADLIVAYLGQIGVEYVFGVPGDSNGPLYDALIRNHSHGGPKIVIACHEAGAAFMADGYARETGKLGVCCAFSGPGATNLITGVACAHENGVPMLVLTGHPPLGSAGEYTPEESAYAGIDALSMFRHCTRYNTLVSHPGQVEAKLVSALHHALQVPRGPVHLSLPADILRCPVTRAVPSYSMSSLLKPPSAIDEEAFGMLMAAVRDAKNIVLLIGGWCEEAIGTILRFAALRGARVVATPDGKALIHPCHPLFHGVVGHGGKSPADAVLEAASADLILAIGFKMSESIRNGLCVPALSGRLIHIDEYEEHLHRTPMARFHVRGRILTIFEFLVARLCAGTDDGRFAALPESGGPAPAAPWPQEAADDAVTITPQQVMRELSLRLPPGIRYLADAGNSRVWATSFLQPRERRVAERRQGQTGREGSVDRRRRNAGRLNGGWLRIAMDFTPAGYAIGAAVGTAAGNPAVPVVCIVGDDSMRMSGLEISVAVAERLTVIYVVLNETAPRKFEMADGAAGADGIRSQGIDFATFARALGAQAHVARTLRDLRTVDFEAMCKRRGPTLLDIRINPGGVCPPAARPMGA